MRGSMRRWPNSREGPVAQDELHRGCSRIVWPLPEPIRDDTRGSRPRPPTNRGPEVPRVLKLSPSAGELMPTATYRNAAHATIAAEQARNELSRDPRFLRPAG